MEAAKMHDTALEILGDLLQDALKENRVLAVQLKACEVQLADLQTEFNKLRDDHTQRLVILQVFCDEAKSKLELAGDRGYRFKMAELWQNTFVKVTTVIVTGGAGLALIIKMIYDLLHRK